MAHNLNVHNGVTAYFGREAAWHVLGQVKGRHMSSRELMEDPCFDFVVFKSQLRDGLGRPVGAWGTFRWDMADKLAGRADKAIFLGPVGSDYTCIQHGEGFATSDAIVGAGDGDLCYETAGVLGAGETVWALIDLKMTLTVGDDKIENYLLFSTSHDGTRSHNYRIVSRRVVCENTLDLALSAGTKAALTIRHTKNAGDRLINARAALASLGTDVKRAEDRLNFLAGKKMNREGIESIMDRLFPKPKAANGEAKDTTRRKNIIEDILHLYEINDGDRGFAEQRGTAYSLLNAITAYADHQRGTDTNTRAEAALWGGGRELKDKAYELVYEAATSLPDMQRSVPADWAALGLNVPVPAAR